MNEYLDKTGLTTFAQKLTDKYDTRYAKPDDFGSPLVASTVAGMTDHDKVYVYVGSETGYTSGHWYYWNGSAWADGGVYNSTAFETDTTLTEAGKAADAKATGDALDTKANKNGSYEEMSVGTAEQLTSNIYEEDKIPYNFRTAGGGIDIGNRKTEKLVGGTLAFNQLASLTASDWSKSSTVAAMSISGTEITMTVTSGSSALKYYQLKQKPKNNHVYYFGGKAKSTDTSGSYVTRIGVFTSSGTIIKGLSMYGSTYESGAYIYKASADTDYFALRLSNGIPADTVATFKDVVFIDLTQMFGATIANYINTLESGTAGKGVEFFKKFFPKDYYAYNAGALMSVKTSAHKTVGFNAYNNTSGKAKLLGGYQYQITGTYSAISFTDINGNAETITPDADGYFTPTNDGEMTVTGGNGTDTCVHLVWDGERDGEWEEYKENTYALDSDLELRGVWLLDAYNNPYCNGDEYESDGTVTRRFKVENLGDRKWTYIAAGQRFQSTAQITDMKNVAAWNGAKSINVKYPLGEVASNGSGGDKIFGVYGSRFYFRDTTYTDADLDANGKAPWLNGVYLVYELATPTTESADAYTNPQIVDDWGTEEYVDERTVPIPVGHDTLYMANLKAKLEMAPNSPDGDGYYIVQQSGGKNLYVPFVNEDELPTKPDEDGTYTLKCTVSSGVATLSWVLDV